MSLNLSKRQLHPQQLSQERRLHNIRNWGAVLFFVGSAYLIERRPEIVSLDMALLAFGIMCVGMYPCWQYLSDANRPPMPFMPIVGIFYTTSFGLPIFIAGDVKNVDTRFSLKAVENYDLFLVLIGVLFLNITFYFSKNLIWRKVVPLKLSNTFSYSKLINVMWIFMAISLGHTYVPAIRMIPSFSFVAAPLGLIAYGMFLTLAKQDRLPKTQYAIVLGVCLPLTMIPALASGLLSQFLGICLFMTMILFYQNKQLPIKTIALAAAVYIILSPVKNDFRRLTWGQGFLGRLDPVQKVQLLANLAVERYTNPDYPKIEQDSTISRSAHIFLFSLVVKDTPDKVPYWNGQTYLPLLTSFIPRFLFPSKPEERVGQDFGHRYQLLDSTDETTSVNLPWIIEMYANFGEWGVYLGMAIVGILLAMLEQKLNNPKMQPLEFVTGAAMLFSLTYQESNLSLMIGGIFLAFLSLMLVFQFFIGSGRRKVSS